jgi:subtilisin
MRDTLSLDAAREYNHRDRARSDPGRTLGERAMRKARMGALVAVVVVLGVLTSVTPSGANGPVSSWIVTLVDDADPQNEGRRLAQQYGGRTGHIYEHALNGFQFLGTEQSARNLERNPQVRAVVADGVVHAFEETAPTGVRRIDAPAAHSVGRIGGGAVVAVIDTGIDLDHPDLAANIHPTLRKDCTGTNGTGDDDNGHGSHVAGTIAAVNNEIGVIGVAPAATLVPVKVLTANGSGSWAGVICGIDYVTANAGTIDVANLSLGGSGSATGCADGGMHEAVCNAVAAGVTVVVAAGNDSKNASGFVPAAYPEAITVSAFSDTNGSSTKASCSGMGPWKTCDEVFASFSNYGSIVDVMAPGVSINSTIIGGYGSKSGTSMAAPHVAGVAALAIASGTASTPAEVDALLKATGECPGVTLASSSGTCTGTWSGDPDGIAEPMVNAARAASGSIGGGGGGDTNVPPAASFTYSCTELTCDFTDTSTDSDGTIASRSWDFGDGGTSTAANPSHGYAAGGTYTVTLTVTDDKGVTGSTSQPVTVSDSSAVGISLSATGYKVKGVQHADLTWSGATSTSVDVKRNGATIATTANDGAYTDKIGARGGGSYTYKVCEAGTTTCSPEVTVTY